MKILVSACLLGERVRFDGKSKYLEGLEELSRYHELIPFCPEVSGGLAVPRESAEIKGTASGILDNSDSSHVISVSGNDFTAQFLEGAGKALNICIEKGIKLAILKSKSPSCGYGRVYDGSHTRTLIDGNGVTAQILIDNDITVLNENNYTQLLDCCGD